MKKHIAVGKAPVQVGFTPEERDTWKTRPVWQKIKEVFAHMFVQWL